MSKAYIEKLFKDFVPEVDENLMKLEIEKAQEDAKLLANKETYRRIYNFIDLTSLNVTDNRTRIKEFCEGINKFYEQHPEMDNVAGVCVYPNFIETVNETLKDDRVKKVVVSGVFPSAQSFFSVKIAEIELSAQKGADEIDVVISVGEIIDGNYELVLKELQLMKQAAGNSHLKVILETGAYPELRMIKIASILSMAAEADFIKTSTGKINVSATPEAAYIMLTAIKEFYDATGKKVGFKPAGGISTPEDALLYYALVKNILGEEWLTPSLFRIGASRLAGKLEALIF
jgi:deoxyribose-phosphate aldolase